MQSPSPPKSALSHFLSPICQTYFPFLQFSTALSLVSNFYSCISNMFSEIGNWLLQWCHQDLQGVLLQGTDHRIRQVTYKFVPNNIPTFWLLALNGFNSIFLLPIYRSCIETISCIKQCNNLGLSLHFKYSLQSTAYILFLVFILNLIWSLHFILTENNEVQIYLYSKGQF